MNPDKSLTDMLNFSIKWKVKTNWDKVLLDNLLMTPVDILFITHARGPSCAPDVYDGSFMSLIKAAQRHLLSLEVKLGRAGIVLERDCNLCGLPKESEFNSSGLMSYKSVASGCRNVISTPSLATPPSVWSALRIPPHHFFCSTEVES